MFVSGNNKSPSLASTTINDNVCDRGNNKRESFLNSAADDGLLIEVVSSHVRPPPVGDTPSVPFQARLKGINQQSNSLRRYLPVMLTNT